MSVPNIRWNYRYGLEMAQFLRNENECSGHYGDHWGDIEADPGLRQVLDRYVLPFVSRDRIAMEIGPGGGRWTKYLLAFERLLCVELNPEMFSYIRRRFHDPEHLIYVMTHGTDLPLVPDASLDFVFSFGTMVYFEEKVLSAYLRSIARAMKPNGAIVLQLADNSDARTRTEKPYFARYTPETVHEALEASGIDIVTYDAATLDYSVMLHGVKRADI